MQAMCHQQFTFVRVKHSKCFPELWKSIYSVKTYDKGHMHRPSSSSFTAHDLSWPNLLMRRHPASVLLSLPMPNELAHSCIKAERLKLCVANANHNWTAPFIEIENQAPDEASYPSTAQKYMV